MNIRSCCFAAGALVVCSALFLSGCSSVPNKSLKNRKIAVQTYTFHKFTLEQTAKSLNEIGVKYVECYPGQKLSKNFPNDVVGIKMSKQAREEMKKILSENGIKMVSFGVTSAKDEKEIEETFKFVKEMGGGQVVTEADFKQIPLWEKYSKKYGIPMALHFHQINRHNQYYSPDVMLYITSHFDVFACPDVGHWARTEVDPVEGLRKLRGKFPNGLHFKDQKTFGDLSSDGAVLGEGVLDVKGMLAELDGQGFDGYFIIEHESSSDSDNPAPPTKKCVEYLRNN